MAWIINMYNIRWTLEPKSVTQLICITVAVKSRAMLVLNRTHLHARVTLLSISLRPPISQH